MSLQSERLLAHMQRLRLTYLAQCYEALAEEAAQKNLPYLDLFERLLEAESQAKYDRNVKLKTQWAHFPYSKCLDQFDFGFPSSSDEKKIRALTSLWFLEHKENAILLGPPGVGKTHMAIVLGVEAILAGFLCLRPEVPSAPGDPPLWRRGGFVNRIHRQRHSAPAPRAKNIDSSCIRPCRRGGLHSTKETRGMIHSPQHDSGREGRQM